ncbi:MAG: hypothetical protein ACRD0J_06150 [Acidimicrobiales bacterium]
MTPGDRPRRGDGQPPGGVAGHRGFVVNCGAVIYNVNEVSYRQLVCPTRLLGRMNATMRFLAWGTLPLGALAGGALGTWLGNRDPLWVAGVGAAIAPLWLLASPLRRTRDVCLPDDLEEEAPSTVPSATG